MVLAAAGGQVLSAEPRLGLLVGQARENRPVNAEVAPRGPIAEPSDRQHQVSIDQQAVQ
jgi:hypothetical protein